MKTFKVTLCTTIVMLTLIATGCKEDKDGRLVEMAERHEQRQAEQNDRAAELQIEVTTMQRELQAERAAVGTQRDVLEKDRRELAFERRYDSLLAAAITNVGLILACLLPLAIAWHLLRRPDEPASDQTIVNVMLDDLVADRPLLLHRSAPPGVKRLTGDANSDDSA